MLKSLAEQSVRPDQCIVVDASKVPDERIVAEFPLLKIEHVRLVPPSLSAQRNAGMRRLRPDITLAGYLDDDLVLLPGSLEAMLAFWRTAGPDVGGARFKIVDAERPPVLVRRLRQLMAMDSDRVGRVLPSGFTSSIDLADENVYVDWLSGGATVWRREVTEHFPYDEWFIGTGYMEDIDYSYRVAQMYRLAVVAAARVLHLSPPVRSDRNLILGQWEVINRLYFVRKHRTLSVTACWYALGWQFAIHLLKLAVVRDRASWDRVMGNLLGARAALAGRLEQRYGILK